MRLVAMLTAAVTGVTPVFTVVSNVCVTAGTCRARPNRRHETNLVGFILIDRSNNNWHSSYLPVRRHHDRLQKLGLGCAFPGLGFVQHIGKLFRLVGEANRLVTLAPGDDAIVEGDRRFSST